MNDTPLDMDALETKAPAIHDLDSDCELVMTAGTSGPCTCGVPAAVLALVAEVRRLRAANAALAADLLTFAKPCAGPAPGRLRTVYDCGGDDDPTYVADCHDPQCISEECKAKRRTRCANPWHRLSPETRKAINVARVVADAAGDAR